MKIIRLYGLLSPIVLGPLVLCGTLTVAPAAVAEEESERVLEEIIVTATKREERLSDVPFSMSLLDSSMLEEQQAFRLQDYFAQVPGLQLNAGSGGALVLAMRGITTGGATNPTVATMLDDVPIGLTASIYSGLNAVDIDPSSLERVEVLRGPQGTLYGASSLGGLVRYVTAAPRTDEFSGRFSVEGMDLSGGGTGYGGRTFMNIPLVEDRLAATVSAFYRRDAGVVDNTYRGIRNNVDQTDTIGGRASVLWHAAENASVRVSALYQKAEWDGSTNVLSTDPENAPDDLTQSYVPGTGLYKSEIWQVDARLDFDFGWANLASITAFANRDRFRRDDVTTWLGIYTFFATGLTTDDVATVNYQPTDEDKFTQEVRLTSTHEGPLEWMVGVYYTDEDADTSWHMYPADLVTGERGDDYFPDLFPTTLEERAVFASVTGRLSDQFEVELGGRWSENKQTFDEWIGGPLFPVPYEVNGTSKEDPITYVVSPKFRINDDMMIYGRVATGYRPGGPNPGAGFGTPTQYDSDTTISYEIGWKADLLDRRMTVDASLYYIDWTDIQLQQRDPQTEFLFYTNGGKAESKGLDVMVTGATDDGLRVSATLSFADSTLKQDLGVGLYGLPGDRLPFTSKFNGTLSVDKDFAVGNSYTAFVGGSLAHIGKRNGTFAPSEGVLRTAMPSYTTLDIRVGVRNQTGWSLMLFGKNLTNSDGLIGSSHETGGGTTGNYLLTVIRPRAVGLSLARDF